MTAISARTRNGESITLESGALEALGANLRGPLLLPGDARYEEARMVWNGMIDRRPALIVRCLGVGDVVATVKFADQHGLAVSIKGGGHNIAGLAVAEGCVMLDMSLMRGVWVDPEAKIARAQAGCLLGDVDRETQLHGLAAVLGFVSNTGIAGLTVGGGFGYTTRKRGWTCDNLLSMEVVTADGRVVTASPTQNADLFWGLSGGGGNFGVVTNFEYKLHPLGPEILGGAMCWTMDHAPRVFDAYQRLVASGPPELSMILGLRMAPPAPWIDPAVHGKPIVALFVCHTGPTATGQAAVDALRAIGKPSGDIVQARSYYSQQSLIDATQPKGRRYYWKSEYLKQIDTPLLEAAQKHAARMPSPHSALLIFPLAGAIAKLPEDKIAAGNRDATAILNVAAGWDAAADDEANIAWARTTGEDLKRFSTGGVYVNFLTEEEDEQRTRAAYGKNFERLIDIKTKWDPKNIFRVNKNIQPRG